MMQIRNIRLLVIICFLFVNSNSMGQANSFRTKAWEEDLDYLGTQLPIRHKNLYHQMGKTTFSQKIDSLKRKVPDLNDDEIFIEISKITALAGDAHTRISSPDPARFPLVYYWFKEGIFVIDGPAEYEGLMLSKLTHIQGIPVEEIIDRLRPVLSYENDYFFKDLAVRNLRRPYVLKGLKVCSGDTVAFTFVKNGEVMQTFLSPKHYDSIPFAMERGIKDKLPSSWVNRYENYWYTYMKDRQMLYFQYNICSEKKDKPFYIFNEEMFRLIDSCKVKKMVIDLRYNGGGSDGIIRPCLNSIRARKELNSPNSLCVLISRHTFSSALMDALDFRKKTKATFAGEPTGGKPCHYGQIRSFSLNHSKITIDYSTKYFKCGKKSDACLAPDIAVEPSVEDLIRNKDGLLSKISFD